MTRSALHRLILRLAVWFWKVHGCQEVDDDNRSISSEPNCFSSWTLLYTWLHALHGSSQNRLTSFYTNGDWWRGRQGEEEAGADKKAKGESIIRLCAFSSLCDSDTWKATCSSTLSQLDAFKSEEIMSIMTWALSCMCSYGSQGSCQNGYSSFLLKYVQLIIT